MRVEQQGSANGTMVNEREVVVCGYFIFEVFGFEFSSGRMCWEMNRSFPD